jgi:hypothetical protein
MGIGFKAKLYQFNNKELGALNILVRKKIGDGYSAGTLVITPNLKNREEIFDYLAIPAPTVKPEDNPDTVIEPKYLAEAFYNTYPTYDGNMARLNWICSNPVFRGKHLGVDMLQAVMNEIRQENCVRISGQSVIDALSFYKRLGAVFEKKKDCRKNFTFSADNPKVTVPEKFTLDEERSAYLKEAFDRGYNL